MNHMLIFNPSAYATSILNSFWCIGMVILVDIAAGDVINSDFIHPHGPRNFITNFCKMFCFSKLKNHQSIGNLAESCLTLFEDCE